MSLPSSCMYTDWNSLFSFPAFSLLSFASFPLYRFVMGNSNVSFCCAWTNHHNDFLLSFSTGSILLVEIHLASLMFLSYACSIQYTFSFCIHFPFVWMLCFFLIILFSDVFIHSTNRLCLDTRRLGCDMCVLFGPVFNSVKFGLLFCLCVVAGIIDRYL